MKKTTETAALATALVTTLFTLPAILNADEKQDGPVAPASRPALQRVTGDGNAETKPHIQFEWRPFPDRERFKVLGLPWFDTNAPKLWRMPRERIDSLPGGVVRQCKAPSGGRIAFRCNSTKLGLRIGDADKAGPKEFDVYINGRPLGAAGADGAKAGPELVLFDGLDGGEKEIVVYLPHRRDVTIEAVGADKGATFKPAQHKYAQPLPVVFYGSSVCQGNGASKSGMTYPAILDRELNLDFINLGFGGAGKAEKDVVALVNSLPACCYVFDLGKSYGMQDGSAYANMLKTVRKSHPDVPMICITPITSAREVKDEDYSKKSLHTRTVMREAVNELVKTGDRKLYLVEGPDLLGFDEHDGLSKDGVHPSDRGYDIIARKLLPTMKKAMGL